MSVLNISRLNIASCNGVEFAYQNSNIKGGRKTITHEFPNSNIRVVEDLGVSLPSYKITAVIDINNINDKNKLINELVKRGPIQLVHPVFGSKKVTLKEFNSRDSIQQLGALFIDMEFEESEEPAFGVESLQQLGSLVDQLQSAQQFVGLALFKIAKVKAVFDSAVSKIQQVADLIDTVSRTVTNSGSGVTSLSNALISLKENTASLVNSPDVLFSTLAASVTNLAAAYDDDASGEPDEENRASSLDSLNSVSDSNEGVVGVSTNILQRTTNQTLINNQILVGTLGLGYQYASEREYVSLEALDIERERLENSYQSFAFTLVDPVFDQMTKVRHLANLTFDNIAIRLERILEVETPSVPLTVLTYSLYGSLANKDIIRGLNPFVDTSEVSGNIKILTQG